MEFIIGMNLEEYEDENGLNVPLIDPTTIPEGWSQKWDHNRFKYRLVSMCHNITQ